MRVLCALSLLLASASPSHGWLSPQRPALALPRRLTLRETASDNSDENDLGPLGDLTGKTVYQRVFYQFTPGSNVDVHKSMVVEERVRFMPDPEREGYLLPIGHRTLILRDGNVEDGEIGDDWFAMDVHEGTPTHQGAGLDPTMESTLATALYLASNPKLCQGSMLEIASDLGLAGLLGCIGAGFVEKRDKGEMDSESDDIAEDILTISKDHKGVFPTELERLTLTESSEDRLQLVIENVQNAGVPASKVMLERLDWTKRGLRPRTSALREYRTIVASDVAFSYPEAKELARCVANRLEPTYPYVDKDPAPTFVHICPDTRDDAVYLHRLLEKGYRMSVVTGYLKLEKLTFVFQTLPESEKETALEDEPLELLQFKQVVYQSLCARHHPDYAGEGSGELFFPIETGQYEDGGVMEREWDRKGPW